MKEPKYSFGGMEGNDLDTLVKAVVDQAYSDNKVAELQDYAAALIVETAKREAKVYQKCWRKTFEPADGLPQDGQAFIFKASNRYSVENILEMVRMATETTPGLVADNVRAYTVQLPWAVAPAQGPQGVLVVSWAVPACPPGFQEVKWAPY